MIGLVRGFKFCESPVEEFGLVRERIKSTSVKIQPAKFEPSLLAHLQVTGELSTLNETKPDCVFEPDQNETEPLERGGSLERV